MSFYAVKSGRNPGIYSSWTECEYQVKGFPTASFKKFSSKILAERFINGENISTTVPATSIEEPRSKKRKHGVATANLTSSIPETFSLMHDTDCPARVVVYTDGCSKRTADGTRAGIGVYWGDDHPWNVSTRCTGNQGNNRAEIAAACVAISRARVSGISRILLCTDSQFTINCATEWGHNWRANGWKLANGGDVQVRSSVEKLMALLDDTSIRVEWCHVAGHTGIPGNEAADRLANAGADKPLPT